MSLDTITYIKVYPGIGTARVGNSPEYFIGPEVPGVAPNYGNTYKDNNGLLKPQAARFRVYGYDANDTLVAEITHDPQNGTTLEWDVHMRNMKAANYAFQGKFGFNPDQYRNPGVTPNAPGTSPDDRTSLIIDPGKKQITGNSQSGANAVPLDGGTIFSGIGAAEIPSSLLDKGTAGMTSVTYTEKEVSLGRLETDAAGRLVVVGGKGDAGCLIEPPIILQKGVGEINGATNEDPTSNGNSYFNNPGWYDDTSGGSINASVTINGTTLTTYKNGTTVGDPLKRGWIAVSPPKYVPTMNNVVSLLDLQLDMFPEEDPVSGTLNFALLGANGVPTIAKGNTNLSFTPLSGVTTAGKEAPSLTSFQGKEYLAYTSATGNNLLAVSNDKGITWSESQIGANTTMFAPAVCVFNDQLVYIVVGSGGYLKMGTSDDGVTFNFIDVTPAGGVQATPAVSSPSVTAYNGGLYIAFTASGGNLVIALQDATTPNLFTFNSVTSSVQAKAGIAPSITEFFGLLYYAYTGTDSTCYLGSYNNYAPAPTIPVYNFNFTQIGGSQTTNLAPAISASHGMFYYAVIGANSNVYLASGKPGFTALTFSSSGTATSSYAPAVANFSTIDFYRDIYPILRTVTDYAWVNEPAFQGHAPGSMGDFLRSGSINAYANPNATNNTYRVFVFKAIRPAEQLTPLVPPPPAAIPQGAIPDGGVQSGRLMPHLFGEGGSNLENIFNNTNFPNQWLSLTPHQLWKIQEWVNGNFITGNAPTVDFPTTTIDQIPLEAQPAALNFSALEPTVGGGFHPGIELTYNMKEPGYFSGPFRFADVIKDANNNSVGAITPGSVAGYMSIPWQGDFWSCNISWWAAMRPDIVVTMDTTKNPPKLDYESWFRGEAVGIPENSDSIDSYEGGYEHMVRYWSYFGFVVPTGTTDEGMFVMGETERATCLDTLGAPCVPVNAPEPIHLGVAQPNSTSTGPFPDTFYSNAIDVILPSEGTITISSLSNGTGNVVVDDKCEIKINGTLIYSHDYSNGNSGVITPIAPVDITNLIPPQLRGVIVTMSIDYIDLHPNSKRGSDYWVTFS